MMLWFTGVVVLFCHTVLVTDGVDESVISSRDASNEAGSVIDFGTVYV